MLRKITVFSILGVMMLLIFSTLFVLFMLLLNVRSAGRSSGVGNISQYKHLHLNPITNATTLGIVSIFDEIKPNECITYMDDEGNFNMISNFGEEEFKCTGTCYCDDDEVDHRKSLPLSTTLVYTGIITLVTAVSSYFAFEKAREYLSDDCTEKLSLTCPSQSIKTEVDTCKAVVTKIENNVNIEDHDDDSTEKFNSYDYEENGNSRQYLCNGKCYAKSFKNKKAKAIAKQFDCSSLRQEAVVSIDGSIFSGSDLNNKAKEKFQKQHLTPYCKTNSVAEYVYEWEGRKSNPGARIATVFACVGVPTGGRNPSIKCRTTHDLRHYNIFPRKE